MGKFWNRGFTAALFGLGLVGLILLAQAIGRLIPASYAGLFVYVSRQDVRRTFTEPVFRGRWYEVSNLELLLGSVDGGEPRPLAADPATDHRPSLSPAGALIAFESDRDGNWEIYLTDPRGSPPVNLTRHPAADIYPAWSPAGSLIAFLSDRDDMLSQLYVMEPDGRHVRLLTDGSGMVYGTPAWSPDGTRIAFATAQQFTSETPNTLSIITIASGECVTLAAHTPGILNMDWSPDGRRLAYQTNQWGASRLYIIDAEGGTPAEPLADAAWGGNTLQALAWPRWSPDGRFLAFQAHVSDAFEVDIFTLEVASGRLRNLTQSPGNDANPAWSADGSHLLFQSWRSQPGGAEIYLMRLPDDPDAPDQEVRRLSHHPYDDWEPLWLLAGP